MAELAPEEQALDGREPLPGGARRVVIALRLGRLLRAGARAVVRRALAERGLDLLFVEGRERLLALYAGRLETLQQLTGGEPVVLS